MKKTFILITAIFALSLAGCHQRQLSILDADGDNSFTNTPEDNTCPNCGKDLDDGDDVTDGDDDTDGDDTDGDDTDCGKKHHGKGKGHTKGKGKGHSKHDHVCANLHNNG